MTTAGSQVVAGTPSGSVEGSGGGLDAKGPALLSCHSDGRSEEHSLRDLLQLKVFPEFCLGNGVSAMLLGPFGLKLLLSDVCCVTSTVKFWWLLRDGKPSRAVVPENFVETLHFPVEKAPFFGYTHKVGLKASRSKQIFA